MRQDTCREKHEVNVYTRPKGEGKGRGGIESTNLSETHVLAAWDCSACGVTSSLRSAITRSAWTCCVACGCGVVAVEDDDDDGDDHTVTRCENGRSNNSRHNEIHVRQRGRREEGGEGGRGG